MEPVPTSTSSTPKPSSRQLLWVLLPVGGFCFCGILGSLVLSMFLQSRSAKYELSLTRLKGHSLGMLMYASDWDDTLPPADVWMNAVSSKVNPEDLECPLQVWKTFEFGFAMNKNASALETRTVKSPELVPMTFEATMVNKNAVGDADVMIPNNSVKDGVGLSFVDGHVARVRYEQVRDKQWIPIVVVPRKSE